MTPPALNATPASPGGDIPTNNRLLRALRPDEFARISPHLRVVTMKAREVLQKQGEPIREVYFPGGGACSLTKVMQDGKVAEIATVGSEGMLGESVFFGDAVATGEVLVQVSDGEGHAMPVDVFIAEMTHMTIVDRAALEKASCECYETVKANFERLLPDMPPVG